jgi:hypothetical protein
MRLFAFLPFALFACTSEILPPLEDPIEETHAEDDDFNDDDDDNNDDDDDDDNNNLPDDDDDDDNLPDDDDDEPEDEWEDSADLPPFVDDCGTAENETIQTASGLSSVDGSTWTNVQLCSGEMDVYRIDVPPGEWLSVTIEIDGSGQGSTDLDIFEFENPASPLPAKLDIVDDSYTTNIIWYSYAETDVESLAWYNDTNQAETHYIAVAPWDTATADYDILIDTSSFHEGVDCDVFYSNTSESGPCNEIMQYPQSNALDQGYVVSHSVHYSHLRREVTYLIRYAADATAAMFPGTNPLGLLDMSESDGSTPGTMVGQLRHPQGTHINGNDIDVAYYQTGSDNLGRSVCPENGSFCTSAPDILDARRSAYFMAKLMESPNVRVIGVDTMIAPALFDAADDLRSEGKITANQRSRMNSYLAYGDGWPFHQHHLHFSWTWESGHSTSDTSSEGCLVENNEDYETPRSLGGW